MSTTAILPNDSTSVEAPPPGSGAPVPHSIVQVVDSLGVGGLERLVVDLANGLVGGGRRVTVVCLREAGPLAPSLDPRVRLIPLTVESRDLRLPRRLRELLLGVRADLVHGHNLNTWWDVALAADNQIAHVQAFHGLLDDGRTLRQRLKGRMLSRRRVRLAAVSRNLARELAELWSVPASRFAIVENGVDTRRFSPRQRDGTARQLRQQMDARFVCVTVASLTPAKSPFLWLEALKLLPHECGVVWVGDGPMRWELAEAARKVGLQQRLIVTGFKEDVRPWLAAADAFVLTSRTEALPVSLLEAMACGLPVVAPRVGAIPTLIEHQQTGLLYEPNDARGLAGAVLRLCAAASARSTMGAAARNRVCAEFSLERMIDRYEAQYAAYCGALAAIGDAS